MGSIRIKVTAITLIAIITTVLALGGIGLFTIISEGNRSSVEKMDLISIREQKSLDDYLNSLQQSMNMAINVADASLMEMELRDYGITGGDPPPSRVILGQTDSLSSLQSAAQKLGQAGTGSPGQGVKAGDQTPQQAAELESFLKDHCSRVRRAFSSIADNTSGVATYYYCINPDLCPTEHGFFYSRVGREEFTRQEPLDARELDPKDNEHTTWYYTPIAAGHPIWIGPYIAHFLNEARTVSYVLPIYKGDVFVGVLGMDILFDTMIAQIEDVKVYDTGFACLLDGSGTILYHPVLKPGSLPVEASVMLSDKDFRQDNSGNRMIRYAAGWQQRQLAYSTLSNGMKLVVTAPVDEINASWHHMMTLLLIVSIAILVIFGVLTLFIMKALTQPLHRLTAASRKLVDGDYDVELEYDGDDEVGMLTSAFRQMRDHLQLYISDLNSRAYSDALTGVRNKGAFDIYAARIDDLIRQNKGEDPPEFAIVMFDCNRLKEINDEYGHDRGDVYLRRTSTAISRTFVHSPVFRLGGDEFAVLLQGNDYARREHLLHDFDKWVKSANEHAHHSWEKVNVSKGIAVYQPDQDLDTGQVLRRADEEMYEHKRQYKLKHLSVV